MCGIVAVVTKHRNGFAYKQQNIFETLLQIDTLRGPDSTGVFCVTNKGNVGIAKQIGTGYEFIQTQEWKGFRTQMFQNGWAMVGHNRKATRGSITDENAHPFWVEDKLVLVHNGSFNGSHKGLADTDVDSEAIARVLAQHGKDDVTGALKKVDAAYALVWFDIQNKELNIIRNSERPLAWAETADAWYFSSELGILEFALNRHDEKILASNEFPEYCHQKWILNDDHSLSMTEGVKLDCKPPTKSYTQVWRGYQQQQPHHSSFRGAFDCAYDACNDVPSDFVSQVNKGIEEAIANAEEVKANSEPESVFIVSRENKKINIPVFPWMKRHTIKEFQTLRDKYPDDKKLTVIVDDYADDGKDEVIVFGKTLDDNNIPVSFKLNSTIIDQLTAPEALNDNNPVFEISVKSFHWTKLPGQADVAGDKAEGISVINGANPVLRFDGRGHGLA